MGSNGVDDGEEIGFSGDVDTDGKVGFLPCHEVQEGSCSGIIVFLSTIFITA